MSSRLVFNGLDPDGSYGLAPCTAEELARIPLSLFEAKGVVGRGRHRPAPGVDEDDLGTSGWGVLFPQRWAQERCDAVLDAMGDLLAQREQQVVQRSEAPYRIFSGGEGVLPGETAQGWLTRQGCGPGPAAPGKTGMPYYLLLVGSPEELSFELQFDLAVTHGVGRLHFDDLADFGQYARGVVAAEAAARPRARRASVFVVDNPGDDATRWAREGLAQPLLEELQSDLPSWEVSGQIGAGQATRNRLQSLLRSPQRPDLWFTSSHGLTGKGEELPGRMGALVCQDWGGPDATLHNDHLFTADDLPDDADLTGSMSFHFACFGCGMPAADSFALELGEEGEPKPARLASRPYLARLPQRLLSHRGGSALAVLGHVDRARGFSFVWPGTGQYQPHTITATLEALARGHRAGVAAQYLSERYAAITTGLTQELYKAVRKEHDRKALADLWTAMVDARSYLLLGDPAVRLAVED